ncbi:dipeptidase [Photobacterium jeanii]|uniref:Dipeptidase n=1 Tax=Photobacterium jeanii TaxID=858640 RepID=A0A178K9B9_9GAMM|nr:C69 family dipeptidase [Photobacterium jeanii]OAN13707.1 dipeptidase [Photobacterium jeanii]PST88828.1 dipeptidase [Photobacterium jeanii]
MKKMSVTLLSAAILSAISMGANACTGLIVGKNATTDGSIIIARNEDFGINNWNKHLAYRPAQNNEAGDWKLGNGLVVPMPKQFYAYSAIPDWDANTVDSQGKYYEERGINEFNVAVSATTSAEVNDKAKEVDPLVKAGVIEAVIPTLILPQVKTAKEGVTLLGQYIEQYGAGEGNSLYIADVNEAWLFEIGSGHHWIAVKVPDDSYAMIANGLRVHGVDLDSKDVMHSKGLFEFVKQHQLLEKPNAKSFNFAKAFGVVGDVYNIDREWLGQDMLSASKKQATRQEQYPLFLKPDQKVSVKDVANVLGATYKGTQLEKNGERPMRVERQLESHIIQLRPEMPTELQGLIWQSFGVLSESVLVPLYTSLQEFPIEYQTGSDTYTDQSAYWQFRSLTALATADQEKYLPMLKATWDKEETKLYQQVSSLDMTLKSLYKSDKQAALNMASDYSYGQLQRTLSMATEIRYKMMTDLTKSTEKKYSEEEFEKIMNL